MAHFSYIQGVNGGFNAPHDPPKAGAKRKGRSMIPFALHAPEGTMQTASSCIEPWKSEDSETP